MKHSIVISLFATFTGCTLSAPPPVQVIALNISKSSIPEGIAVHPESKEIFLSSIHEDRLTKSSPDGRTSQTVLTNAEHGYSIGVGIDIWQHELYALGKDNRRHQATLTIKDLNTQETAIYKANGLDSTYFNDLAIDTKGNCYITDTDNHYIYFFDKAARQIKVYLKDDRISYPNGITISGDGGKLFIDSYTTGIKVVEISSKKILNAGHNATTEIGIDGLKYHNGYLYYIRNGGRETNVHGLYKLRLSDNETRLGAPVPIVVNHEKMNLPTTFSIVEGVAYILANSQMDNLNQVTNEIIEMDKLTNTFVLSVNLKGNK